MSSVPRKARQVEAGLRTKGFRYLNSRHRKLYYYGLNGEQTPVATLLSHGGNRDLNDHLLAQMARQCRLTRREFDRLIDCPLSQAQYEQLLSERGHI